MAANRKPIARKGQTKTVQIAENISLNEKQHEKLLTHLLDRLNVSDKFRCTEIEKYSMVDKEIAGYLKLDQDDKQRRKERIEGKSLKPTDSVLGLIFAQMDEAVTFLMTVLAPDEGIYNAIAPAKEQAVAKGFSTLMNEHADDWDHYVNYAKGILNGLRYNFTGWWCDWEERFGTKLANDATNGVRVLPNEVISAGNFHDAIDPYNFLYDGSVDPVNLPNDGEYCAGVDMLTQFRMEKMEEDGKLFGVDRFRKKSTTRARYYKPKPEIRADGYGQNGQTNWINIFSMTNGSSVTNGFEIVYMYCWVKPKDFGLSTKKNYEIWRFSIVNGQYIANAVQMQNAHGMLPVGISIPIDDGFFPQTKSYAEWLLPMQEFASYQLNVHKRSQRKKLNGLTIYNKRLLPSLDNEDVDMTGGRIPMETLDPNFDVNKAIKYITEAPDTDKTLQDVAAMDDLMQKLLPTDLLKQVATLERATEYQAAATVQGSNRRNLKIAKLIDSQALRKTRDIQYYNILQFQKEIEILNDQGELVKISPAEFRSTKMKFLIHAGLRGLDRLSLVMNIKEVLNSILQSQTASAQIDVVALINYWTSMLGDHTDFSQFKYKTEFDKLPPDAKNLAFQLLQQELQTRQQQQGGQRQ